MQGHIFPRQEVTYTSGVSSIVLVKSEQCRGGNAVHADAALAGVPDC